MKSNGPFEFTSKAQVVGRHVGDGLIMHEIGVWTDGIGVYCDTEEFCAYRLTPGVKYRVTVEPVKD
jgi:hypothetical protein